MLSMVEKGAGSKARLAGEQSNACKQSQAGRQAKRQATGHNRQARLKAQSYGFRVPTTQKIMGTIVHSLTLRHLALSTYA